MCLCGGCGVCFVVAAMCVFVAAAEAVLATVVVLFALLNDMSAAQIMLYCWCGCSVAVRVFVAVAVLVAMLVLCSV